MTTPKPATSDTSTTNRYDSIISRIERMVSVLNADLGLNDSDTRITFGYLGNSSPRYDDRSWSVFLPHPGRVGVDDDRIGWFRTGDSDGALATLNALIGFRRGATWQRHDRVTVVN